MFKNGMYFGDATLYELSCKQKLLPSTHNRYKKLSSTRTRIIFSIMLTHKLLA